MVVYEVPEVLWREWVKTQAELREALKDSTDQIVTAINDLTRAVQDLVPTSEEDA
jgi:hypothetical protein